VTADVTVPPEALLIARMRQRAPRISMSEAARRSGISLTRWRQIENGFRPERGVRYRETGPAQTIARMAAVVGISSPRSSWPTRAALMPPRSWP
jgi:hypothetical protein